MTDDDPLGFGDEFPKPDPEPLLEQIKAGDYDGSLVAIVEAVRMRFTYGPVATRWKIEYEGETFTEEDLTLTEAATVENQTATSWGHLNPISSATECQAIIAACLHHRQNVPLKDALFKVGQMTANEAVAAISQYEVDAPPKD